MTQPDLYPAPESCNCAAIRRAARHVTQFYDEILAPSGLRTTQFSILAKLSDPGPKTINALAAELVMDRTTLSRNILPLARGGFIAIEPSADDRRAKELHVTEAGAARLRAATALWQAAQSRLESAYGGERAAKLRLLLGELVTTDLAASQPAS